MSKRAQRYNRASSGAASHAAGRWAIGRFIVNAASGILAVASLLLPWKEQGNGSSLSAARLAATLTSGPTALPGGSLVAAFVYGIAVAGCVLLVLSGAGSRIVAVVRLMVGAALVAALVAVTVRGTLPMDQWARGPYVVVLAGSLAVVTSAPALVKGAIV